MGWGVLFKSLLGFFGHYYKCITDNVNTSWISSRQLLQLYCCMLLPYVHVSVRAILVDVHAFNKTTQCIQSEVVTERKSQLWYSQKHLFGQSRRQQVD